MIFDESYLEKQTRNKRDIQPTRALLLTLMFHDVQPTSRSANEISGSIPKCNPNDFCDLQQKIGNDQQGYEFYP